MDTEVIGQGKDVSDSGYVPPGNFFLCILQNIAEKSKILGLLFLVLYNLLIIRRLAIEINNSPFSYFRQDCILKMKLT